MLDFDLNFSFFNVSVPIFKTTYKKAHLQLAVGVQSQATTSYECWKEELERIKDICFKSSLTA